MVLIRTAVSYLLVGCVGVLQGSARGLQDPTLPLPPHWLPKAPVTSLPLRKVCSGVKQKAATLPPHFCSQSGAPHSQPPGHPKKPLQAARSPEAPLSHPHSPRGNSLAHLPLPMNSHLSRQHEGSGPGVWKPQGGPEHRRGSALLSGETASSPCTSVPPGPDEPREASSCPGGGSHPPLFTAVCLPLRTHFQAGCVIGRSLWGVEGGAQGPKGFSPHFSRGPSLLRLSLSCAHSCRGSPEGRPRLRGSDSREALCCPCGCPRNCHRSEKRPLWKTPRAGFEPLVDLADHPGVRQPPALSESKHPASLAAGQQGGPCASR